MKTKETSFDIVCFSNDNYNDIRERPQQVMTHLRKKGIRILYIQPPIWASREVLKRFPEWLKSRKQNGIYTYRLPLIIWENILLNKSLSIAALRRQIRELRLGEKRPLLLWFYNVHFSFLAGKMGERLSIYDCVDELSGFSHVTRKHIEREKDLLKRVEIVFVTSSSLFERKKPTFSKRSIYTIRNAADFNLFSKTVTNQVSIPKEMQKIGKPIIGFIGRIGDWIDFQLVRHLATAFNVVMIGPVATTKIAEIQGLPNVYLLGRIDYSRLPSYLKAIDVCILPFKLNKLTESANPIKIYEYLAAGKPVVSTSISETEHFAKVISIAANKDEFLDAIRKELEEVSSHEKILERTKFAKKNSWESRCEGMLSVINRLLSSHTQ